MTKYNNDDVRRVEVKPVIAPRAFDEGCPFSLILEKVEIAPVYPDLEILPT